jgi:pimeloyl-ACP methyl ester carboxylesterase
MTTVLLVHGAYQGGWIWSDVSKALMSRGYRTFAPSLDGCGERQIALRPGITTESQAEELAKLLFYEDLANVHVVGTSLGGMVACKLAELVPERIGRLFFVDAVALLNGERVSDFVKRPQNPTRNFATGPTPEEAAGRLFADLEPERRRWATARTTMHPVRALEDAVQLENFWERRWNASVVWCRNSFNPPKAVQWRTAQLLNARWHELETGHYPMLSEPEALAEIIVGDLQA